MFAHYTQGSNNLSKAAAFYDALLTPLGIQRQDEINDEVMCYSGKDNNAPRFFLVAPYDNRQATVGNGTMIAFTASNRNQVDASYKNGISTGGTDEGAPGNRLDYADGYYGAYLRDPDGNKIHIVYRGDLE